MIAPSNREDQSLCLSEQLLIVVKGQKPRSAQMQCGGDMQNVSQPMSALLGVAGAQVFGELMHVRPVHWEHLNLLGREVGLHRLQHPSRIVLEVTFGSILGMESGLKPHGLAKLQEQQTGYRKRPRQRMHVGDHTWGMHLLPVERAKKGCIRKSDHPSSPSNSASRIAMTSVSLNTRSPQIAFSRPAKSVFFDVLRFVRGIAVSIAMGSPRFSMHTDSPSLSHASSTAKLFRRSLTVAVFMWTYCVHVVSLSNT